MSKSCKTGCLQKSFSAPLDLAESVSIREVQETSPLKRMLGLNLLLPEYSYIKRMTTTPRHVLILCNLSVAFLRREAAILVSVFLNQVPQSKTKTTVVHSID